MKTYILVTPIGIFALDKDGEIISKESFKFKTKDLLKNIDKFAPGNVPKEIEPIINDLKNKGYELFIFEDTLLANRVQKRFKIETEVETPCNTIIDFKEKLPK